MVNVTPFRIDSPVSATLAVRSFTSRSTSPFAALVVWETRARTTAFKGRVAAALKATPPWRRFELSKGVETDATETETVWDMIAADIVRMRMRTSRKLLIVA
jgi:hypothetical protein